MVCTLGSKPQGPCERRGQRRRPTSRYWFPAIGRQLQRVGCTPSTGANLILWHTRILFHAICTFVFPRMIARCRVTRPPQANSHCDPFRPSPWPRVRRSARACFGPRAQSYLLSTSSPSPSPLPHTIINNTGSRRTRNTICGRKLSSTATPAGRKKEYSPTVLHASRRAIPGFLTCIAIFLVIANITTYH